MDLINELSASNDITIFTSYTEITDASGTVLYTTSDISHAPIIVVIFLGFGLLFLFKFMYWQIQHRLENKKLLK